MLDHWHPLDWSIVGPALVAGLLVLATHVPLGMQVLRNMLLFAGTPAGTPRAGREVRILDCGRLKKEGQRELAESKRLAKAAAAVS